MYVHTTYYDKLKEYTTRNLMLDFQCDMVIIRWSRPSQLAINCADVLSVQNFFQWCKTSCQICERTTFNFHQVFVQQKMTK